MNQDKPTLSREFALVRVVSDRQDDALRIAGAWSARLIELSEGHFTAELSTTPDRISQFLDAISEHGQVTALRSGALSFS
jgi:acetolactate synthase small subunit